MTNPTNPFNLSMVELQIAPGMGSSISIGGFNLEANDDGIVEVPKHLADELRAHGLTDPKPKATGKKG